MSRLRNQRGLALVELMTVIVLLSVVIGAVVGGFTSFIRNQQGTEVRNDAQDTARTAMTTLSRELRNLAGPKFYEPRAVLRNGSDDFIFQTVAQGSKPPGSANDRNIKRVRYCLEQPATGAGRIKAMEQTWTTVDPPDMPADTACPGSGWSNVTTVAQDIVNAAASTPLFSYVPEGAPLTDIRAVRSRLLVDTDLRDSRPSTPIQSAVFLRNQNRAPVALMTATYTGNARQVVLNGSASEDPEGHALKSYTWYREGQAEPIGRGIVFYWTAPDAGSYNFRLVVEDHAGLLADASSSSAVNVP
jgi:type II secretory pathway component PulJ